MKSVEVEGFTFTHQHDPEGFVQSFGLEKEETFEKMNALNREASDAGIRTVTGMMVFAAERLKGIEFLVFVEMMGAHS